MKKRIRIFATVIALILSVSVFSSCINIFIPVSMWDGEQLKFTLTASDVSEAETLLSEAKSATLNGSALSSNQKWNDFLYSYYNIVTQYNMATVSYYGDLKNEGYKSNYLFANSAYLDLYAKYLSALKEIYNSSKRDSFFSGWTEEDLSIILYYDDEVSALEEENDLLLTEYDSLTEEEFYDGSIEIYQQMLKNYDKIADKFGYDNYYDYATKEVYGREYGEVERSIYRNKVAQNVVPISQNLFMKQGEEILGLTTAELGVINAIIYEDYDAEKTLNYYDRYVSSYTGSTKEALSHAFANKNFYMTDNPDAQGTAFTVYMPTYNEPFCFFGPNYQDVFTVIHELGHYYAYLYSGLENLPMDLNEVHSQANEMLLLEYLNTELDEKLYGALESSVIAETVSTVLVGAIVDSVEEKVYDLPPDQITSQKIDEIIDEVCSRFGGKEYVNNTVFGNVGVYKYFRMTAIRQPIYYLSYSTSATTVLAFYVEAKENSASAREKYRKLIEESNVDATFSEALQTAGFKTPFEDSTYTLIESLAR
ncbi:MAG: hypothetical protein E7360_03545 [Clostridiales bacterium]|nr:hypothetical protein [Clostridiales bacterium]